MKEENCFSEEESSFSKEKLSSPEEESSFSEKEFFSSEKQFSSSEEESPSSEEECWASFAVEPFKKPRPACKHFPLDSPKKLHGLTNKLEVHIFLAVLQTEC